MSSSVAFSTEAASFATKITQRDPSFLRQMSLAESLVIYGILLISQGLEAALTLVGWLSFCVGSTKI